MNYHDLMPGCLTVIAILGIFIAVIGSIVTMFRMRFRPAPAIPASKPPPRFPLRAEFITYGIALLWFFAAWIAVPTWSVYVFRTPVTSWAQWSIVSVSIAFIALTPVVFAWSSYRLTRHLRLLLEPGQPERAALWGWLSIIPIVNLLIWLLFFFRLRRYRLPGSYRYSGGAVMLTMPLVIWFAWDTALLSLLWFVGYQLCGLLAAGVVTCGVWLTHPENTIAPTRRYRRCAVILAVIPVLMILATLTSWGIFTFYVHSRAAAVREKLATLGVLFSPEEMAERYALPSDNAYRDLTALSTSWRQENARWPDPPEVDMNNQHFYRKELPSELRTALAETLSNHAETVELLTRLSPDRPFRFPAAWDTGPARHLPELSALRSLARFQTLRLLLASENGDLEEISQVWAQGWIIRNWLFGDSIMASLVGCAVQNIQAGSREILLNRWEFPDSTLRGQMAAMLATEARFAEDWRNMYRIEAFLISDINLRNYLAYFFGSRIPPKLYRLLNGFPFREWLLLNRTACLESLAEVLQQPGTEYAQLQPWLEQHKQRRAEQPFYYNLLRIFEMPWRTNALAFSEPLASLRVHRAALAAELYRRKYGHWPKQWSELVPEFLDTVPLDPFDGQPLRITQGELAAWEEVPVSPPPPPPLPDFDADEMVKIPPLSLAPPYQSMYKFPCESHPITRSGFMVYSIGRDLTDNGGKPLPPGQTRAPDTDITFSWYR